MLDKSADVDLIQRDIDNTVAKAIRNGVHLNAANSQHLHFEPNPSLTIL